MGYKVGDIVIDTAGYKREILVVTDSFYIISAVNDFTKAGPVRTEYEMKVHNYKLFEESIDKDKLDYIFK